MKRIMAVCLAGLLCPIMAVKAQWVTFDPSNFAQSIVNTTRNVVQTTTTAENMVNEFSGKQSRSTNRGSVITTH